MRAIGDHASRHYGIVCSADLEALHVSRQSQSFWVARGYLKRLHEGVFCVGDDQLPVRGHWLAATRSFRCGAFLSHRSAAELWGFGLPRLPIHVTVPKGRGGHRTGCRVHESRHLPEVETTVREGIPVTSLPRTLLDLSPQDTIGQTRDLSPLEDIAVTAIRKGMTSIDEMARMATRAVYRPGAPAFRELVSRLDPDILGTRSHGERLLKRLVRESGLPRYEPNAPVCGYEVDALWRDEMQIVELDGRAYHSDAVAFEGDRERDAVLKRNGYDVLRISYRMLVDRPEAVIATIRDVLTHRRRILRGS